MNNANINKCPFCGGDARIMRLDKLEQFTVTCIDCGAKGPIAPRVENAATSWNAATPSRQKWLPIALAPVNGKLFLVDGGPLGEPRLAYFSDGTLYVGTSSFVRCTNIAPPRFAYIPER